MYPNRLKMVKILNLVNLFRSPDPLFGKANAWAVFSVMASLTRCKYPGREVVQYDGLAAEQEEAVPDRLPCERANFF